MPLIRIDDASDPRLSDYRDVTDAELLQARGVFVAEGRLVVARLIANRRYAVRSVLVSEAAHRALAADLSTLPAGVPVYVCRPADLISITGIDFHRGCLAMIERPEPVRLAGVLGGRGTVVILEAVTNPDNVGGVFRNAAAFGVDAIVLSPTCCDPLYRKAIRTSMSATLQVPYARAVSWPEALEEIRLAGLTIAALTPRQHQASISPFDLRERNDRIALLVGTEGAGLSAAAEARAALHVRIPMHPGVDSLNLAVATGIALFALSARSSTQSSPRPQSQD